MASASGILHSMGTLRIRHPVVGSTMTVADHLARHGAPHGTVVIADVQTAGHGRQGRRWETEAGSALLTSWIIRFPRVRGDISALSPVVAHAVLCALRRFVPDAPMALKWPNDVLADGRKIAGILLAARGNSEEHVVITGIGINLDRAAIPPGVAGAAVAEWSAEVASDVLLDSVAVELHAALVSFLPDGRIGEQARADIDSTLAWRGESVAVIADHGTLEGVIVGIDEDGALLLDTESGCVVPVRMGEIERGPRLLS